MSECEQSRGNMLLTEVVSGQHLYHHGQELYYASAVCLCILAEYSRRMIKVNGCVFGLLLCAAGERKGGGRSPVGCVDHHHFKPLQVVKHTNDGRSTNKGRAMKLFLCFVFKKKEEEKKKKGATQNGNALDVL